MSTCWHQTQSVQSLLFTVGGNSCLCRAFQISHLSDFMNAALESCCLCKVISPGFKTDLSFPYFYHRSIKLLSSWTAPSDTRGELHIQNCRNTAERANPQEMFCWWVWDAKKALTNSHHHSTRPQWRSGVGLGHLAALVYHTKSLSARTPGLRSIRSDHEGESTNSWHGIYLSPLVCSTGGQSSSL